VLGNGGVGACWGLLGPVGACWGLLGGGRSTKSCVLVCAVSCCAVENDSSSLDLPRACAPDSFLCAVQLDYDLGALDLPGSFISEQQQEGWEALAGLTGLQVSVLMRD
jgi:hypothetical protein